MNLVKQTVLHDPDNGQHGNCLSAVIASLLHVEIATVPTFCAPETWVKDLNVWLRPYGLAYCMVEDFDCHIDAYGIQGLHHEISGNTVRSKDVIHACVAKDGEFAFDPHPDNTGLTRITCHGFFIALRPWEVARKHEGLDDAQPKPVFVKEGDLDLDQLNKDLIDYRAQIARLRARIAVLDPVFSDAEGYQISVPSPQCKLLTDEVQDEFIRAAINSHMENSPAACRNAAVEVAHDVITSIKIHHEIRVKS